MVNKKIGLFLCCTLTFLQRIYALENTINADYLRTLNRSASMGTSDAMFFNPAGLIYLNNDVYLNFDLGLSIFYKNLDFQNTASGSSPHFVRSVLGVGLPAFSVGYAKKENNGAFYFTLSPTVSSLFFLDDALSSAHESQRINYQHYDVGYEATFGYALPVHDIVALSIGGRMLLQLQGANDTYYTWGSLATSLSEIYRYHSLLIGAALQTGILITPVEWFSASLNIHSGSILVGGSLVFHEGPGGALWNSAAAGRPQGGLMTQADPARIDVGLLFNIQEIAALQLTAQMKLDLLRSRNGLIQFDSPQAHIRWSTGAGIDFNLPSDVILGFGVLYSNDLPYQLENHYELLRAIELGQMQSISFGLGASIPVNPRMAISLSAMMPVYFDSGFLTSQEISSALPRLNHFKTVNFIFSLGLAMKFGRQGVKSKFNKEIT